MRIEPELDEVINGARGMLRGIDVALEAQCLVSGVGLIFATIDSLAALSRPENQESSTRRDFLTWSDRYVRPDASLGCSSVDLYAARCGVLHTYSAESDLARGRKARRLVYEWKAGPKADTSVPLPAGSIIVEVEALRDAVLRATAEFLLDSQTDPVVSPRVKHHLPSLLCYAPWPRLEVQVAAEVRRHGSAEDRCCPRAFPWAATKDRVRLDHYWSSDQRESRDLAWNMAGATHCLD